MKEIRQKILTGERALFQGNSLKIIDCTFEDGESPLKESGDIELVGSMFKWKYPLWYGRNIRLTDCTLFENARAGIWYTQDISLTGVLIEAPKTFRRASGIALKEVRFSDSAETLWSCRDIRMEDVFAKGDYFAMNCDGVTVDRLDLVGNYSFDGAKNVVIRNSKLLSKDAFWNSENVTICDSFISGEYFGWNAKNLTLINCTVESLQGFCYIENLVMKNCKLINTTLAFEYSSVDVEIVNHVDSIVNPSSGKIVADSVGTLILDEAKVDPERTEIVIKKIA